MTSLARRNPPIWLVRHGRGRTRTHHPISELLVGRAHHNSHFRKALAHHNGDDQVVFVISEAPQSGRARDPSQPSQGYLLRSHHGHVENFFQRLGVQIARFLEIFF